MANTTTSTLGSVDFTGGCVSCGCIPCKCYTYYYYPTYPYNSSSVSVTTCEYCNGWGHKTTNCPRVQAIEYYPSGQIKKITFHKPE